MSEHAVDVPSGRQEAEEYVADPRRWRILGVALAVGFMSLLDVSIVNVAIPSMRAGLDTTAATIQWVVSGYALAFGLTLVAGGRLGDAYGRRRMMLIGLAAFVVASAAVGLAPTAPLVVVARLVQGAAAGLLTPQNSGLIQQLFRGAERGRAFGVFGFTVATGSALGPVLGGLIIAAAGQDDGWRWLFLINLPIGLLAMVAVARMVPRRAPDRVERGARIDVVGAVLLGLAVLALLFPVVSIERGARLPLLLLVLVPVLAAGFVRWELRLARTGRAPLLDIALLRRLPGYGNGLTIGTLYFTGFTGLILVTSVYLQEGRSATPLQAGLLIIPFAVGSAVSSPIAGRFVSAVGRPLTVGALLVMMTGTLLFLVLAPGRDPFWPWAVPTLLLAGLGGGAVISPNITLTLAEVPPRMGGAAGGALQTGQRIGAAIGAALLMTVYGVAAADPDRALRLALATGLGVLALALVMAVRSLRQPNAAPVTRS